MASRITMEEFIRTYGHIEVTFSSYYKYSFTWSGELPNGDKITVSYGGCHDDIYRYEVSAVPTTIASIDPSSGTVYHDDERIVETYEEPW